LALVVTQIGSRYATAAEGALVSIPTTALLFWIVVPLASDLHGWRLPAAALFAFTGLFFPAVVTLITFESNKRMGPTVTGAAGSTTPVFAAIAAILFLGERPRPIAVAAIIAVFAGVLMLSWRPKDHAPQWDPCFLLLPLSAAMVRGTAQVAVKLGLAIWPNAYAAGLIGYSASVFTIIAAAKLRGVRWPPLRSRGGFWFSVVGVCNGMAVLFMYASLNRATVAVIAPIVATYPLFVLLFGARILPQQRVTKRLVFATALIVVAIGALLLDCAPR
jgi:drug/metabolite transporter (DMT)-like permease